MIDDDFLPDRIQYRALGHLLVASQNQPWSPSVPEQILYQRVYERAVGAERLGWMDELIAHGLVAVVQNSIGSGSDSVTNGAALCLSSAGIYYAVSRAGRFSENAHTPTDDFPDAIVDTPWALHAYYSSGDDLLAPTADTYVRFDHNVEAFEAAARTLEDVQLALAADNEIGANNPQERDRALRELRAIRELLEKREGWKSKLITAGWGALGYIMTQFSDRPVSHLAEKAWDALQSILGLS